MTTNEDVTEMQNLDPHGMCRKIFDRFDLDCNEKISINELSNMLKHGNFDFVPPTVAEHIHEMSDTNNDGDIDFEEFVAMFENPRLKNYFQRNLDRYVETIMPTSIVRYRRYHHEFQFWPPPLGMILISLLEVILFFTDEMLKEKSTILGPIAKDLVYDSQKRHEIWRFITYMFVHDGVPHLVSNLVMQLMLGIPLEMVHKYWRVLIIYMAGVLAGSLGFSIFHSRWLATLCGASGGVFAIITAHIATIIMNWREMKFATLQLIIIVYISSIDFIRALHETLYHKHSDVSHITHAFGVLAGLLVGINVLRNLRLTYVENVIWWISLCIFGILLTVGIALHVFWTSHFS